MAASDELERLLSRLDVLLSRSPRGDAIDAVLALGPRTTAVGSLHDHEAVVRFRDELAKGQIAAGTATRLLNLLRMVVETGVPP